MRGKETSLERNVEDTVEANGNLSEPKPLRLGKLGYAGDLRRGLVQKGSCGAQSTVGHPATWGGKEASEGQILATREVQTPELSEEEA